ncbi:MAG: MBOAT family protein [Alphaproteobacteria bacterium]|nr:MAG: MBOAT family protein [Alphaproteobacteria bacterium]
MLFNSYAFLLVFLPAAIIAYRFADPYPRLRMPVLIVLSLIFYGYWDVRFLPMLVGSILVNWLAAKYYVATKRGGIVTAAIVANLAALAFFKYLNFFAETFTAFGLPIGPFALALPLGISFFTFHHIMYLVDLRRGKAPAYALDRYAMYVSFFPQAIAGPLARWHEVMHQFGRQVYAPGWQRQFALGITFIVIGLIEKTMLGDPIGRLIDPIYAQARLGAVPDGQSWLALGFMFQILFDFAGYSDVAIGVALLFGVQLPYNFAAPFRASSLQDFWQRWHMTLLSFLRDYLFHPLANARIGRRHRLLQHFAAMIVTMALCGLWHGPSWTYVLWGVIHGSGLVIVSLWRRYGRPLPLLAGWALVVAFALATTPIFRAGSLDAAWHVYRGLALLPSSDLIRVATPIIIAALAAFLLPASQNIAMWLNERPRQLVAAGLALVAVAILIELGDRDAYEFVYFQF